MLLQGRPSEDLNGGARVDSDGMKHLTVVEETRLTLTLTQQGYIRGESSPPRVIVPGSSGPPGL